MPFVNGNAISGTLDTLAPFLADLKAGNIYLNVHTEKNPNGEIRGQVLPIPGIPFEGMLDAAQAVPNTTASGVGIALMWLNPTLDSLYLNMLMSGLTGPIDHAFVRTRSRATPAMSMPTFSSRSSATGSSASWLRHWD